MPIDHWSISIAKLCVGLQRHRYVFLGNFATTESKLVCIPPDISMFYGLEFLEHHENLATFLRRVATPTTAD